MAYSKKVYSIANQKLLARLDSANAQAQYRRKMLFSRYPRLDEIERELSSIGISTAKAVLKGQDAALLLSQLKEKSLDLQKEFEDILSENGYSKDYLEPQYVCDKCNDTGYIEANNKTVICECFKKLLSDTACEELNKISPLSLSTFDSFNLNFYSHNPDENGNIPYNRMIKIYDYCLSYAKNFNHNSKGILMKGNTGLGKTHLSLAIANEVIRKGYSVIYVSAPDILSKLEQEHFSYDYDKEQSLVRSLIECDLLIIDDLGTEFKSPYTSTAMYNLFNSRINSGKPVIINTNLNGAELERDYSQRFVSRVMATCDQLDFIGTDIRARL